MEREEFFKRVAEEVKKQLAQKLRQAQAEQKQNPFAKLENDRSIMVVCLN